MSTIKLREAAAARATIKPGATKATMANANKRSRLSGEKISEVVPGCRQISDEESHSDGSEESTLASSFPKNLKIKNIVGSDTGSIAEAGAHDDDDVVVGLGPDEDGEDDDDFHKGMMEAMEDGVAEDEDDLQDKEFHDARDVARGDARDENGADDDDEEEYYMGMMNAMEDGVDADDETQDADLDDEARAYEHAVGMMEAMEQEEDEDEHPQEGTAAAEEEEGSSTILANLSNNIFKACSSVSTAVRDYYRMSQDDQVQVWEDMTGAHCHHSVMDEPKDMVEAALKQLPMELQRMPSSHPHDALDLVLEKAPHYVNDRAFLLKFLRAEKFDVFATAVRICRHFEEKLDIFGEEALGREITLDDFDEGDMESLKSGYLQILHDKDVGSRPVIFYYKALSGSACYKKRENILKSFWYTVGRISQDEEVQKLGVSNVVYNIGGFPKDGMDYEKSRRLSRAFRCAPVRYNNFYVCLDDKPWLTVVETFAVMITRFVRVRLRMIRGTHEEAMDKLKAVGVPADSLPVNAKSELIVEPQLEWVQQQRDAELKERDGLGGSAMIPFGLNEGCSVEIVPATA